MPGRSRPKRILQTELIVLSSLSSALLGLFLLETFGLWPIGRDPRPIMLICAIVLIGAAFAASYFSRLSVAEHVLAIIPWLIFLYWLVSYGTGLAVPDAIFMWWFNLLAATLTLPWMLGALLGAWARRKTTKTDD